MAPYKIIRQGYMLKEPPPTKRGLRKKLHRYWFVMVEDKHQVALVYFKTEDSYLERHRNVGFIRVDDALSISVIGEYLGAKNGFSITSPKHKYILVTETRYDLHEWIQTLHNSLESFKKRKVRAHDRSAHRQRASSASSTSAPQGHRPRASSASSNGGAHAKTPPTTPTKTTPTRRAPPPPPVTAPPSSKQGSSPRRRPVRPAPVAPGKKPKQPESPTDESSAFDPPPPMLFREDDFLPPGYSLTSQDSSEQFGGFHYERHPIMDLDISLTDHDFEGGREGGGEQRFYRPEPLPEDEGEYKEGPQPPPPAHTRSASDSLVNFHENSGSLQELRCGADEHEKSTSPEDGSTDSDLSGRKESHTSPKISHTRHLSLMCTQSPVRNKKRSKRTPSLKKRSRSPPELPPPPPPPGQEEETSAVAVGQDQEAPAGQPSGQQMTKNTSSSSIGFTEVMNTMSTIEKELDKLSPEPEPPTAAIHTPPPITGAPSSPPLAESTFAPVDPASPPVPEHPEGRREEESEEQLDFSCLDEEGENGAGSESEDETDMAAPVPPVDQQGESFDTPVNFYSGEISDYADAVGEPPLEWRTPEGAYLSPVVPEATSVSLPMEQAMTNGVGEQSKAPKAKKTVMFKEEVEDIPTYEPRVDEEIPSTVAELKMMLFGQQEGDKSKFKRGEGKRLDYYPEERELDYEYHGDGSTSPNHNNNNSGAVLPDITEIPEEREEETGRELTASSPELPPPDLDGEEGEMVELENVYDTPWDQKPASKYVSQGATAQKRGSSSPLEQREKLHFAEVSVHDGPIPGNSELRNVHSLERPMKQQQQQKSASADLEGSSLLESISSTLQSKSRYGSDSLLNNISPTFQTSGLATTSHTSPPLRRERQEVRSARAELEKIKAEHRRDPHYSPKASPRSALQQRARERTRFVEHNGHPPRMTVSLDELQRDTEVRYDSSTHAHIYRSLV